MHDAAGGWIINKTLNAFINTSALQQCVPYYLVAYILRHMYAFASNIAATLAYVSEFKKVFESFFDDKC